MTYKTYVVKNINEVEQKLTNKTDYPSMNAIYYSP